jgi:indole-3-glycerol phosphate synthase
MNELERIVACTREALAGRKQAVPQAELERAASERAGAGDLRPFAEALRGPGLSLVAEHKRRSPSAGSIRDGVALEDVVRAYERGGAAALSILTEGPSFGGSLDDLGAARASSRLPILRKDFVVDPYQLWESLAAGADAILLIVAALSEQDLRRLHEGARSVGLDALIEVHEEQELEVASAAGGQLIGINNRDLTTLEVDTATTLQLLPRVPVGAIVVAESGLSSVEDLERLAVAGVDAVLVGEALMRSPDIERACRGLVTR